MPVHMNQPILAFKHTTLHQLVQGVSCASMQPAIHGCRHCTHQVPCSSLLQSRFTPKATPLTCGSLPLPKLMEPSPSAQLRRLALLTAGTLVLHPCSIQLAPASKQGGSGELAAQNLLLTVSTRMRWIASPLPRVSGPPWHLLADSDVLHP